VVRYELHFGREVEIILPCGRNFSIDLWSGMRCDGWT